MPDLRALRLWLWWRLRLWSVAVVVVVGVVSGRWYGGCGCGRWLWWSVVLAMLWAAGGDSGVVVLRVAMRCWCW